MPRIAEPLRRLFAETRLTRADVGRHPEQECLILKVEDREVEYEDTDTTRAMRQRLRAYNDLLARTFVDIPTLKDPVLERVISSGPEQGTVERVDISPSQKFVRRIFSRGRWDMNGRFYGPWWQRISKADRARIFINDAPTTELDFQGLHLHLLSLELGVPLEGDPYELPAGTVPGSPAALQRAIVKALVLKAINARDSASGFRSFREDWPSNCPVVEFADHLS